MVEAKEKALMKNLYNTCPECDHPISEDNKTGDYVCRGCGVVFGTIIDNMCDIRYYSREEMIRRKRTGPGIEHNTRHLTLTSYISRDLKDGFNNFLTPKAKVEFHRLIKRDNQMKSRTSLDKNIYYSTQDLEVIAAQLQIPNETISLAALIYKKSLLKKMLKGKKITQLIAASLYTACKINRIVISLNELERISDVTKRKIWRAYSNIVREHKINNLVVYRPIDFLSQIVSSIKEREISKKTENLAAKLLRTLEKVNNKARDQRGVAAAALYCAAIITHERITQKELSKAASINETTIRNSKQDIIKIIPAGGFEVD